MSKFEIVKYLDDNNFNINKIEFSFILVVIKIYGHWKDDHIRLNDAMSKFKFKCIHEVDDKLEDEEWYKSTHIFMNKNIYQQIRMMYV